MRLYCRNSCKWVNGEKPPFKSLLLQIYNRFFIFFLHQKQYVVKKSTLKKNSFFLGKENNRKHWFCWSDHDNHFIINTSKYSKKGIKKQNLYFITMEVVILQVRKALKDLLIGKCVRFFKTKIQGLVKIIQQKMKVYVFLPKTWNKLLLEKVIGWLPTFQKIME